MLPFAGFCWKTIKPCLPRKKTRVKLPQLKVAPKETESRAENQARSSVLSLEKSFLAKISQLSCRLWCRCLCRSADSLAAVSPQGRLPLYPQWKVGGMDLNLISSCLGVGGTCTGTRNYFFQLLPTFGPSTNNVPDTPAQDDDVPPPPSSNTVFVNGPVSTVKYGW